jgi:hypothetical protein
MALLATGSTLAFGTTGESFQITNVDLSGFAVEEIDVTHMGTTTYREFIQGDLTMPPELSVEFILDPDVQPPIGSAAQTVTLTFKTPSGATTPANLAGTGFVREWSATGANEEHLTGSMVIKFDGQTGPTWTAST